MPTKRKSLFSFLFGFGVACSLGFANLQTQNNNDFYPDAFPILHRKCYTLCYDGKNKGPIWVYERLTPASLDGGISREGIRFKEDIDLSSYSRSSLKDYKDSGFDKGHMCPAGDCTETFEAMEETFLLSNIIPQNSELNRNLWKKLENQIRELVKEKGEVKVYTGPVYLPENSSDGKRYMKYQVIGKNDVAVPTHLYKLIQAGEGRVAYIIPNQETELSDLHSFEVSVAQLERAVGFKFP